VPAAIVVAPGFFKSLHRKAVWGYVMRGYVVCVAASVGWAGWLQLLQQLPVHLLPHHPAPPVLVAVRT
jgi:hypothetical protein